jgi:hypothetical protein
MPIHSGVKSIKPWDRASAHFARTSDLLARLAGRDHNWVETISEDVLCSAASRRKQQNCMENDKYYTPSGGFVGSSSWPRAAARRGRCREERDCKGFACGREDCRRGTCASWFLRGRPVNENGRLMASRSDGCRPGGSGDLIPRRTTRRGGCRRRTCLTSWSCFQIIVVLISSFYPKSCLSKFD